MPIQHWIILHSETKLCRNLQLLILLLNPWKESRHPKFLHCSCWCPPYLPTIQVAAITLHSRIHCLQEFSWAIFGDLTDISRLVPLKLQCIHLNYLKPASLHSTCWLMVSPSMENITWPNLSKMLDNGASLCLLCIVSWNSHSFC